ncbi:MAG: hypothetical protein ACPG4N_04425 [Gammaproteobacteria bacterium]
MSTRRALILSELGVLPRIGSELEAMGWEVHEASNQRRAVKAARQLLPDLVVAEYIFTPDFRDRVSNLDTLCGQMQVHHPDYRLVIVHEQEDEASLVRFRANYPVHAALAYPVDRQALLEAIAALD